MTNGTMAADPAKAGSARIAALEATGVAAGRGALRQGCGSTGTSKLRLAPDSTSSGCRAPIVACTSRITSCRAETALGPTTVELWRVGGAVRTLRANGIGLEGTAPLQRVHDLATLRTTRQVIGDAGKGGHSCAVSVASAPMASTRHTAARQPLGDRGFLVQGFRSALHCPRAGWEEPLH